MTRITRRLVVLAFACAVAATLGASTPGSSAATRKRPTACALLTTGLAAGPVAFRIYTDPDPGSDALHCTRSDGKPPSTSRWAGSLWLMPYPPAAPSIASAKLAWSRAYAAARARDPVPERLRGFGADDAYGLESQLLNGKVNVTTIFWRKGVYLGELSLRAPNSSNLGDLEDATDILSGALRRLPRR